MEEKMTMDIIGNEIKIGDTVAMDSNPFIPARPKLIITKVSDIRNDCIYTEMFSSVGIPGNKLVKVYTEK